MSDLSYERLSSSDIESRVAQLDGWSVVEGMLTKEFKFDAYASGVVFASAVGHTADKLNHHPDLFVGYGKVRVSVLTHDAGGLTSYDFELARRVEAIA